MVRLPALQRFQNSSVQRPASLVQEARVSDLMRERMFERVLELWEQAGLIEEFSGLEICEISAEITSPVLEGLKQDNRYVLPDHRGRLQQTLCLGRESIDPPGQQRLHRCRHSDRRDIRHQAVRAAFAGEGSRLHQGPHGLFQEKRVALGLIDQQTLERCKLGTVTHQSL